MNWNNLTNLKQLDTIDEESKTHKILIYKHSTRCGICDAVQNRLERNWKTELDDSFKNYYLDLLQHRDVSNEIAKRYGVEHQSPQVLIIKDGRCIYSESQMAVSLKELLEGSKT